MSYILETILMEIESRMQKYSDDKFTQETFDSCHQKHSWLTIHGSGMMRLLCNALHFY